MKLTRSVSYAVGVLLRIHALAADGARAPDGHVTAARIAHGCRFPPRFLYRILRRLVDADLLRGTSGPGGGYSLAKSPARIKLLDIVEAVDAPPEGTVLVPACAAQREAIAELNRICQRSAEQFARELGKVTLATLVRHAQKAPRRKRRAVPRK